MRTSSMQPPKALSDDSLIPIAPGKMTVAVSLRATSRPLIYNKVQRPLQTAATCVHFPLGISSPTNPVATLHNRP